jgi:DNA-binding LytR/AlgR family response regulator
MKRENMNKQLTAIVAEDEELLRADLIAKLNSVWPELEVVASCEDGAAALEEIAAKKPQLAFLDIQMPGLTGLDVAAALPTLGTRTEVVFVTAYNQYAVDAFNKGAIDYLLKPVTEDRLAATVERLKAKIGNGVDTAAAMGSDGLQMLVQQLQVAMANDNKHEPMAWITAGSGRDTKLIMVEDIAYFQADNKYTVVMTAEGESLIRTPIKELLEGLDAAHFKQIHRSTIVNLKAIKSVTRDDTGKGVIHLKALKETLQVSQPFMHLFRSM